MHLITSPVPSPISPSHLPNAQTAAPDGSGKRKSASTGFGRELTKSWLTVTVAQKSLMLNWIAVF